MNTLRTWFSHDHLRHWNVDKVESLLSQLESESLRIHELEAPILIPQKSAGKSIGTIELEELLPTNARTYTSPLSSLHPFAILVTNLIPAILNPIWRETQAP